MSALRALFLVGEPPASAVGRWLLLFLAALVLRSASLAYDVMDIDQAHWSLIGRMILDGHVPYVDFADHKPPGVFYLFAGFAFVTGKYLLLQALVVVAWVATTASFVGVAARRITGSPRFAFAAAVAYVVLSSSNVLTANGELLSDLFIAASLAALGDGRFRRGVLAGALAGVAALVRPQAGVLGVALGLGLLVSGPWLRQRGRILGVLGLGLGAALPAAAAILPFYAAGLFHEFWDWNVTRNLGYPPPPSWGLLLLQESAAHLIGALGWAVALAVKPMRELAARLLRRDGDLEPTAVVLFALLPLSALAVSSGLRFYSHYFIQLALPLALLAGPRLRALLDDARARGRRGLRVGLAVAVLLPTFGFCLVGWLRGWLGSYPGQDPRVRAISDFVNQPSIPPGPLALWGDSTQIYLYTDRYPASRFYNAAPLIGNFDTSQVPDGFDPRPHISQRDVAQYLRDFAARPPTVIVDTASAGIHDWNRFPMSAAEPLFAYVQKNYALAGEPAGAKVYVRKRLMGAR